MAYNVIPAYQKSLLSAHTDATVTLAVDDKLYFNTINILDGVSIDYTAGSTEIYLDKSGIYQITLDIAIDPTSSTGDVILKMSQDGTNVKGATITQESTSSAGTMQASMTNLVKVVPSCPFAYSTHLSTIAFTNTSQASDFSHMNLTIIKLC